MSWPIRPLPLPAFVGAPPCPPFVLYRVAGVSSCPFLARAERLALLLSDKMGFSEQQVQVEMKEEAEWESYLESVFQEYPLFRAQYSSLLSAIPPSSPSINAKVIIFSPSTQTLIGTEKQFREELSHRYGIECDIQWSQIVMIAKENVENERKRRARLANADSAAVEQKQNEEVKLEQK